ncbi:inactive N-acetylated-alpha-linked acidic dipeptidase-like protein 2 isoform X2 [Brachyhypopomus gauderio]|uniref:inactive N-acetylated-alpha-linked acidic dipeptidase-like protein 2 isoform X2 n=1 Tax=Brachyhypopomus gauderio TaxID=698409 RepID=UPI0040418F9E
MKKWIRAGRRVERTALSGQDMAYRMVRASRVNSTLTRDLDTEDLQGAPLEMEWEMEKELEEPGLDRFRLEGMETRPDPDMEPIQLSMSPHGHFQRLQEDPNYASCSSRVLPQGQRSSGTCVAKYLLAVAGVFLLGLLVGLYAQSPRKQPDKPSTRPDLLERVTQSITAEKIQTLFRDFNSLVDLSEESRVTRLVQYWEELGLKDVQLSSYDVLVSHAGPSPNTIMDMTNKQCYLANGVSCDSRSHASTEQRYTFAAYSAVGSLEEEVVDVQYGSTEHLRRVRTEMNVTNRIALLKLGQAPLLYTLSRLAEMGFGACLIYVDPCDVPLDQATEHQAFGVTLNPGGDPSTPDNPSTPGCFREDRHNLTSMLVQPISASLARELLAAPSVSRRKPCVSMAKPPASERKIIKLSIASQTSYQRVHNVIGYMKGKTDPDRYVLVGSRHGSWYEGVLADWRSSAAVVTQIIASVATQTHTGWQPDRTIVFSSWGGTAMGNIGSFEWGEENRVVLASRAVAYVSVRSPVSTRGPQTTASPSLFQLASDIHKRQSKSCVGVGECPGLNVSALLSPVALDFFSSQMTVPVVEFTYSGSPVERACFLSEASFPSEASLLETLDPAFKLHETVAKMTAEAILRLATDPVLPFCPLDIALDIQKKLKDDPLGTRDLISAAASLREKSSFFQSELMRPANDPRERDPSHMRMLNDVLRDLEKAFLVPSPPPGFSRNILYSLNRQTPGFAILKAGQEQLQLTSANRSLSQVFSCISSAERLIQSGIELFENDPENSN